MHVAVLGSGPVGRATAGVLAGHGHAVRLIRPRGAAPERALPLRFQGALEASISVPFAEGIDAIGDAETVVLAIPATAYGDVLPPLARQVLPGTSIVFGGALSLAPLWLARQVATGVAVIAWGTTLATASLLGGDAVRVGTIRARFDIAPLPPADPAAALALCGALFGDRFDLAAGGGLASALSNVNPIAHAAQVMGNLTRIDRKEAWPLFGCFTESVAAICAALDAERMAIATAFGVPVRSIETHYHLSYHVPLGPLAAMVAAMEARGLGPNGPTTLRHRYVEEDMPFGLAFLEALGRAAGVATPALSGALALLGAAVGQDLRAPNWLIGALGLDRADAAALGIQG